MLFVTTPSPHKNDVILCHPPNYNKPWLFRDLGIIYELGVWIIFAWNSKIGVRYAFLAQPLCSPLCHTWTLHLKCGKNKWCAIEPAGPNQSNFIKPFLLWQSHLDLELESFFCQKLSSKRQMKCYIYTQQQQ